MRLGDKPEESTMRLKAYSFPMSIAACAIIASSSCALFNIDSGKTVADQGIALESKVRAIPARFLEDARNDLHVAYQHTSHGYHVSMGMYGLQSYKDGDDTRFGITNNSSAPVAGKLDFHDLAIGNPVDLSNGVDSLDGNGDPTFVTGTRTYLDDPANADINVLMWSWCDISGHNIQNYLDGMDKLIAEYGEKGSKIGTGSGDTHPVPVTFIFMTGHAFTDNVGDGRPKNQADRILAHCREHKYFCLDYYGIDSHDMEGTYFENADDGADGGTTFYDAWQASHAEGEDWFYNLNAPNGTVGLPPHNNQHITANRKAYAMWWILARVAGWGGY
jgi:hypothetical protein